MEMTQNDNTGRHVKVIPIGQRQRSAMVAYKTYCTGQFDASGASGGAENADPEGNSGLNEFLHNPIHNTT